MAIKVTPYIDTTSEVNKTTTPATNQVFATEELSFKEMLASEQQAQAALAVDQLVRESANGAVSISDLVSYFKANNINVSFGTNMVNSAQATNVATSTNNTTNTVTNTPVNVVEKCPEKYKSIFAQAANEYNVSEKLLMSIAMAESGFNANATSNAGAMGLMQLMPTTAAELGVTDAYDPTQNIMGGAKLISKFINRYDGNVSLALAAYNAGPGNVDKYGGIPPFTETQNYVSKILNYLS